MTTYDIDIPEIKITERLDATNGLSIMYRAEAATRPTRCTNPKCRHAIKSHVHSSKTNVIKDIKAEGKIVIIELTIRRYRCPDCGYVFPDEFTFYGKNEHITKRLKQEFVNLCIKGETFRRIATDYSVDGKTVAQAFNEYAEAHRDESVLTYTPVILGIDEAHIDDHYRLVLTDILNKKLIDIKKNNHKFTVRAYLRTLDKNVCKCVTMDFAEGYATAVKKVLPDAYIVIDHFHIIQLLNRCVRNVRIDLQKRYRSQGYDTKIFKDSKRLFETNWEDLTPTEMDKMSHWFALFPDLYEAYMVKETFRDIYVTAKDYIEASRMFDSWMEAIPPFEQFSAMKSTFERRREHILNFWLYRHTNAFTESTNRKIKEIEKSGRGYKFDMLRDRCILAINSPTPEKFDYKNTVFVSKTTKEMFLDKRSDLYKTARQLIAKAKPLPATDKMMMVPFSNFSEEEQNARLLEMMKNLGHIRTKQ